MAPPPTLGKYRLLAELGRGGMATVYLAAVTGPGGFQKLVVVKELRPELAQEIEFRDMFLDEARLAARLTHPNIVQTYEVIEEPGLHLIVMEYLEGQAFSNVRARLAKLRQLELADHVFVIASLLEGLHAAHEAADWNGQPLNVVHRDVSPHNIFVTYAGAVKVVDFGIAKAATSSQHTRTGVIKGKVSYMAPEQAMGRAVDRRADIFAVGVMLWEAICSRRLWKDMPDAGILHALATGEIPHVTQFVPDADKMLVRATERALAPDPGARFLSAAEMKATLEEWLQRQTPRPTPSAFGSLVASAFAHEREKIRSTIEEQMHKMSSAGFSLVTLEEAGSGSSTSSRIGDPTTASGALAVETGPRVPPSAPPPQRNMLALAIVGGFIAAFLLAGVLVLALRPTGEHKTETATSVPSTHLTSTPTAPESTSQPIASTTTSSAPTTTAPTSTVKPKPTVRPTATAPATTTTTKPPDDIMLKR